MSRPSDGIYAQNSELFNVADEAHKSAILLSLPIDYLFSGTRFLTRRSWHKAFILRIA